MSKKQLLNESEIRRFMKLANLEPLAGNVIKESFLEEAPMGAASQPEEMYEVYGEDSMQEMPPEAPGGEEEMDLGSLGGGDSTAKLSPEQIADVAKAVVAALGGDADVSVDGEGDGAEQEAPESGEEGGEEESGEESEEESGEEGEEEADEEEAEQELQEVEMEETLSPELQEALIQKVLSRVTARLVAEAKKAKKDGKKVLKGEEKKEKKSLKQKMDDKKKKLKEANAPAPKSTNSNGPKKGEGSATKGNWGVSSKIADQEWKEGKDGKGGHKLETVSASAEHIVTHGKTNLATKGSVK